METKTFIKIVCMVLAAIVIALAAAFGLSSCNVTRTITTTSSAFQRGDTAVSISTKTVEVYDATKKSSF